MYENKNKSIGRIFTLSLSLVILFSSTYALLPDVALAKAGAKQNFKSRIFRGTVFSIDQEKNNFVLLRDKTDQTFTVSYYPSLLHRSSGGRAQETELNAGDKLKVKGVLQVDGSIVAKKITDESIKKKTLTGFTDSVDDGSDTLDLQVKNQIYQTNIEEYTDLLYRSDTLQNGRTKTKVKGIVNENTKKVYKTEYIIMWSKP